jgi:hypothetical protein
MSFDTLFLERLAEAIDEAKLDAILVGNAASIMHGAPVLTTDADLLIRDTPLNRRKLKKLVDLLGGVLRDINDLINAKRIHLTDIYVDILFDKIGGGLSFNSIRSRATKIQVDKHALRVASLEDVIKSKEGAGRDKDLAVLPILRNTLAVQRALKRV